MVQLKTFMKTHTHGNIPYLSGAGGGKLDCLHVSKLIEVYA